MNIELFDYRLPDDLIAQEPVSPRDSSRLMVVDQGKPVHRHFYDLPDLLKPGDVLVMNDTKVINARLFARRETGGQIEVLLTQPVGDRVWLALIRPAKRVHNGEILTVSPTLSIQIEEKNALDSHDGSAPLHRIRLLTKGEWTDELEKSGTVPIPPYIRQGHASTADQTRYQTRVARNPGAVAAPTAGLHFTDELMFKLTQKGVLILTITLHVGYGTFKPIAVADVREHRMHEETYFVSSTVAEQLTKAKTDGRRIIAVGTTSARTLESAWADGHLRAGNGMTNMYIYPGYAFKAIDGLITNFHLPKSSLLVLISAFGGIETIRSAYAEAIAQGYRFYSYGDGMLIWPEPK